MRKIVPIVEGDGEVAALPILLRRLGAWLTPDSYTEYEAWFLASADSLDGKRGLSLDDAVAVDPEVPRDAKGWLSKHMPSGRYREVTDQPAFSAVMDLQEARKRSRSFRKLCSEWMTRITEHDG